MQISLVSNIGSGRDSPVLDGFVERLRSLRDVGFRRVWCPQSPYKPDLLTLLAAAFREVDGIEVGTGVLPIQVQHPTQLAQRALLVNEIGCGRLRLGIGVNHVGMSDQLWGIAVKKPVQMMREYLDGLLPLLAGESASAVGEMITTRAAIPLPGAATPQVYLAALGPQMLRLAGRRSAGTVTWMTGPKTLAEHIVPTLRDAAEAASRDRESLRVIAFLPVCVTDDVDGMRARAAEQFALFARLPSYRAMFVREGVDGPADVALIGDEATVFERIAELRRAGVDEFGAALFGDADARERSRALLLKAELHAVGERVR